MTPVFNGDGVDLLALPAVGERVDPVLPVLELLELGVEPSCRREDLSANERREPDRVPIEQAVRVVRRKAKLPAQSPKKRMRP